MNDTYTQIWNRVLLRCPAVSSFLAKDWVTNAFRRLAERRRWSWLIKYGQFVVPAIYNTGTVTVTLQSTTVTGAGTAWTNAMVGRQFRLGNATPIYTIAQVNSATSLDLDNPYGSATQSAIGYQIYQCYFTPPTDFHAFMTVWDPAMNWQLWRNIQQGELNTWDAQRSNLGQAYCVASFDYTTDRLGIVAAVNQSSGSGPDPVSTGTFTAPANAIFTVECTLGGITGTATFKWKKNEGSYTSGVLTDSVAQALQDGVQIYWPTAQTYVLGDIWVIQCTATQSAGLPRYEIWPHQTAAYVYPFLYEARAQDLQDTNAVLPRYVRGDVLLEMALAESARWPGPSPDKPSPYFNLKLAEMHDVRAEKLIMELERQDDETYEQDMMYQLPLGYPYATPLGDASWLQSHAI
jgi:hypothetical protein